MHLAIDEPVLICYNRDEDRVLVRYVTEKGYFLENCFGAGDFMTIDLTRTLLAAAAIKDIHKRAAESVRRKKLDPHETVLAVLRHARETLDKATAYPAPKRADVALRSIACRSSYGAAPYVSASDVTKCEAIIDTCNAYGNRGTGHEQDDALDRLIMDLMVLPRADEQQIASRAGISVNEMHDRITDRAVRIMMRLAKECPAELQGLKVLPSNLRCLANKCTPDKYFWFFRTTKKEIWLNTEPGQPGFMNEYSRAREMALAA